MSASFASADAPQLLAGGVRRFPRRRRDAIFAAGLPAVRRFFLTHGVAVTRVVGLMFIAFGAKSLSTRPTGRCEGRPEGAPFSGATSSFQSFTRDFSAASAGAGRASAGRGGRQASRVAPAPGSARAPEKPWQRSSSPTMRSTRSSALHVALHHRRVGDHHRVARGRPTCNCTKPAGGSTSRRSSIS